MSSSDTPPAALLDAEADGVPAPEEAAPARHPKGEDVARVAKVIARSGLCSRRDAEAWIAEGRVAVNGTVLTSPALDVGPGDEVAVDGYPIAKPEKTRLFTFHKTRGLVTTARDPEGRPTVFDALPPELPRLMTIGRLDINTEGLLLLTNDGGLARLLELPATGWIRRYRVRANGSIDQAQLDKLQKGLTVEGVTYAGIAAKLDRVQGANLWLTMGLKEGKNREIKRVLEHLGLAVTRLIRISYGPFQLGDLAEGAVEEVRTRVLRDQLGTTLAKKAGVDFEGPAEEEAPPEAPKGRDGGKPAGRGARGKPAPAPTAGGEDGPRRLTRRSATADRRGRAVTVERVATAPSGRARPRTGAESEDVFATRRPRGEAPMSERGSRGREAAPQGRDWAVMGEAADSRRSGRDEAPGERKPRSGGTERPSRALGRDGEAPRRAPRPGPRRFGEDGDARGGDDRSSRAPRPPRAGVAPAGRSEGAGRPPREGGDRPRSGASPRAGSGFGQGASRDGDAPRGRGPKGPGVGGPKGGGFKGGGGRPGGRPGGGGGRPRG